MDPLMMRKVQSMGNLHLLKQAADDHVARIGESSAEAGCGTGRHKDGYTSDSTGLNGTSFRERKKGVSWSEEEHRMFLIGLQKLGKGDWRGISRHYVQSRTPTQVASHAQKYFIRQNNLNKRKRRSSLFDIVTDSGTLQATVGSSPSSAFGVVPLDVIEERPGAQGSSTRSPPSSPLDLNLATNPPPHLANFIPFPTSQMLASNPFYNYATISPKTCTSQEEGFGEHPHEVLAEATQGRMLFPPVFSQSQQQMPSPWIQSGLGYTFSSSTTLSLASNPKLCKPTASLANPSNWPSRCSGILELDNDRISCSSSPPKQATPKEPGLTRKGFEIKPVVDNSHRFLVASG
mmetsp:Transcript_4178/g.5556  ORF Transcript_4178/g.5556 Transcript_4178/m.5556 type:complete len:347 (+) Transcript_4178:112-1152(+)